MNPPNKFFQHNKLEDFSMQRFRFIDHDEDNRPMMDEDGNWQYKVITERAKAFEDWKKFIDNSQNLEKNPEADRFLERMVNERSYDIPELLAIIKEINKNTINKHIGQRNLGRNLKGKEWDTLPILERDNRINEVEIINNPTKYQKRINDLIKDYENAHHKQTYFNNELQKRATQPGFEFFKFK